MNVRIDYKIEITAAGSAAAFVGHICGDNVHRHAKENGRSTFHPSRTAFPLQTLPS